MVATADVVRPQFRGVYGEEVEAGALFHRGRASIAISQRREAKERKLGLQRIRSSARTILPREGCCCHERAEPVGRQSGIKD